MHTSLDNNSDFTATFSNQDLEKVIFMLLLPSLPLDHDKNIGCNNQKNLFQFVTTFTTPWSREKNILHFRTTFATPWKQKNKFNFPFITTWWKHLHLQHENTFFHYLISNYYTHYTTNLLKNSPNDTFLTKICATFFLRSSIETLNDLLPAKRWDYV